MAYETTTAEHLLEGYREIKKYIPGIHKAEFLIIDNVTGEYAVEITFHDGWYLGYSEFRQSFYLTLVTDEVFEREKIVTATHLRINEDVYVINQADSIVPMETNPSYKFFCQRFDSSSNWSSVI